MNKIALVLLLALAACANAPPPPTQAPSGITSSNGGGMRPLGAAPNSSTRTP